MRGLSVHPTRDINVSFYALNGVMYFLWWETSINALIPVQVHIYNVVDYYMSDEWCLIIVDLFNIPSLNRPAGKSGIHIVY